MNKAANQPADRLRGGAHPSWEEIDELYGPEKLPADFWDNAVWVEPNPKELISIRLDREVLDWFKQRGRGYQARINSVLRKYVQAQKLAEAKEQGRRGAEKAK